MWGSVGVSITKTECDLKKVSSIMCTILTVMCIHFITAVFALIIPTRSPQFHGTNTLDMYVDRNISYMTAPSHSTTSGPQTARVSDQTGSGAAAEYSRIGPSYENSRRQQPVVGRNRVSARLSERYEFSEPHLVMTSAGGGGVQGEAAAMDYEVPLQSGEHEEYSHLRH